MESGEFLEEGIQIIETWKRHPKYEGVEFSSLGRARSYWRRNGMNPIPHLLKLDIDRRIGYGRYHIRVAHGRVESLMAHQLIAETFLSSEHKGLEINHKNTDKLDNRPENLEWVTHKENMNYAPTVEKTRNSQQERSKKIKAIQSYMTQKELWPDFSEWRKVFDEKEGRINDSEGQF